MSSMIKDLTLENLSTIILFLVAFIGGAIQLIKYSKTMLKSALKEEFEPIKSDINCLKNDLKQTRLESNKNFLVKCFDDLENGKYLSETTIERIHESFEDYEKIGGNGYIHSRYEKLKGEGKL